MKICTKCGVEKPIDAFRVDSAGYTRGKCRECARRITKNYQKTHLKKVAVAAKNWNLKNLYGITLAQYNTSLAQQENKCACCNDVFLKTPHVDHDHKTKNIRGLLCGPCNTGIGHLKESSLRCFLAASYLQKFGS